MSYLPFTVYILWITFLFRYEIVWNFGILLINVLFTTVILYVFHIFLKLFLAQKENLIVYLENLDFV